MRHLLLLLFIFLSKHLIASPDFLVIGVTKCGTTSLYDYLIQHPKILGAKTKELHFFDLSFKKGIDHYKSLFHTKKSPDQLTFEASPGYFWKEGCLERIAQAFPKIKLIVIFRNPVKRAISHYYYFCKPNLNPYFNRPKAQWKNKTFEDVLYGEDLSSYQKKINWRQIIEAGYYYDHLQRWLKYYPRENIHIVILEELEKNTEAELNKIFNFLGLDDYKIPSCTPKNVGSYDKTGSITPKSITMLNTLYKKHNQKLEKFLGRKLPWNPIKEAS